MNSKPLIALSLVLNLALAVALAWMVKAKPAKTAEPAVVGSQPAAQPAVEAAPAAPLAAERPAAAPAQAFDWRLVESEDYKKYIANLRAIGCPEETIRDIIIADVNKLFESRKREITSSSTNKFQFWKAGNFFASMADPERIEKEQALAKEKRELLKELLGVAPEEKPNVMAAYNPYESMLDFLPSSKQTEVLELIQKYQAKTLKGFSGGTPDAEDMKQMQKTQKEMEAELAKVLSPQEFEDYQLRMSQTAMMMRFQLGSFDPSEQEFRDIFKSRKAFDDEYSVLGYNATDAAERKKRTDAETAMKEKIKAVLGDSRYAEYDRSQDFAYQSIHRVAERNNLGKDAAITVYEMKKLAEDQAKSVRADKALDKAQRDTALAGIRSETENAIRSVLGDKGLQSLQSQPGGYWLNTISRGASTSPSEVQTDTFIFQ